MWEIIPYIGSAFSLAAFIAAVTAWVIKVKTEERSRLIETANPEDRADLVRNALEFFHVNPAGLTRAQQYSLALEQIHARATRFRIVSITVCFLAVVAAAVAMYAFSNPSSVDVREAVEDRIRRVVAGHKTTADTICTALGSIGATDWPVYKHWLSAEAMPYVVPDAAESLVESAAFIDSVSKVTFESSRAILNDINSQSKLYLAKDKENALDRLRGLDRSYQALTEVLLYELGENKISEGAPFLTEVKIVRVDSRNDPYCDETRYEIATTQTLGRGRVLSR